MSEGQWVSKIWPFFASEFLGYVIGTANKETTYITVECGYTTVSNCRRTNELFVDNRGNILHVDCNTTRTHRMHCNVIRCILQQKK